jgi:predicted dehydrogenase
VAHEIGIGVVGYGLAGRTFHAPLIEAVDGLALRAIVTASPARRAQAGTEHPDAAVVDTVDALLERADVEVVVVASPNRSHVPIGLAAVAAGRDVVIDKPLAIDVAEGERLIEAATRAGRLLTVFQNRRWDGDFLTVRRLIDEGALGPIDSLEARFERWSPVADEWRESADEAGGPLADLGAHLIDQSLVLFGPARRVWAQSDRRRPGSQVDDATFVAIDHLGGVRSRLWMSLIASHAGPRFRVRGQTGEYIKAGLDPQEDQLLAGLRPDDPGFGEEPPERRGTLYPGGGEARPVATETGQYVRFYEMLRDAVRGDGTLPVDARDSLEVLRVMDAAERSARTGTAQLTTVE